ncbi:hypothetical protein JL722_5777 [Aureococcus anophagefferens]|nr:hypothetical protein JL722_5777 [Aureococcus anophagefferens]
MGRSPAASPAASPAPAPRALAPAPPGPERRTKVAVACGAFALLWLRFHAAAIEAALKHLVWYCLSHGLLLLLLGAGAVWLCWDRVEAKLGLKMAAELSRELGGARVTIGRLEWRWNRLSVFDLEVGNGEVPGVAWKAPYFMRAAEICVEINRWFGTSRPNFEIL